MSQFQSPQQTEPPAPTRFSEIPYIPREAAPVPPAPPPDDPPKKIVAPSKWEIIMTIALAGIAAGGAFFGSNWDSGYMQAVHVAGTTFFVTLSGLITALGIDPRRRV